MPAAQRRKFSAWVSKSWCTDCCQASTACAHWTSKLAVLSGSSTPGQLDQSFFCASDHCCVNSVICCVQSIIYSLSRLTAPMIITRRESGTDQVMARVNDSCSKALLLYTSHVENQVFAAAQWLALQVARKRLDPSPKKFGFLSSTQASVIVDGQGYRPITA